MEGLALMAGLFAVVSFWYGFRPCLAAIGDARAGVLNVPALVIGAVELWSGGAFSLAAGTLSRDPASLPDRPLVLGWTAAVFVFVLAVVLRRRPEVEAGLPDKVRRSIDGRYILIGAVIAAVVFALTGYW